PDQIPGGDGRLVREADRVDAIPLGDGGVFAVGARVVRGGVAAAAVRLELVEGRALGRDGARPRLGHGGVDGAGVVAVAARSGDAVALCFVDETGGRALLLDR